MKRFLPLLIGLAIAAPAVAQPAYDPQAEADRSRAQLQSYGAQYDAQAAQAAANEAQTQLTLRRIEAARARPDVGPQAYDPQTAVLQGSIEADAAQRRSADAEMRELDARLREMDAFLARPK